MEFTLTVETAPDRDGRQRFVLDWTDAEGRPRGQYFNAIVADHARALRERGHTVTVRPLQGGS